MAAHCREMELGKFGYTLVMYPNMHITHNIHPLLHKSESELMNLMKSMLVSSLARTSGRVMQAGSTGREPSIALLRAGLPATLQLRAQPFPNHLMSFFLV